MRFNRPRAFVSYRHQEHAAWVETIAGILQSAGFHVWLDRQKKQHVFWRLLGDDGDVVGLNQWLRKNIHKADVLLFLVPLQSGAMHREVATHISMAAMLQRPWQLFRPWMLQHMRRLKHRYDRLCMRPLNSFRNFWYKRLLGTELGLLEHENWQAWEQRVSHALGTLVIQIAVVPANRETPPPGNALVLHANTLAADVQDKVLPQLQDALAGTVQQRQKKRSYIWLKRITNVLILALVVFGVLFWLLESAKNGLSRLADWFRKNLLRRARNKP